MRETEKYTPERRAEFLLSCAVEPEDYEVARQMVKEMGFDPDNIPHNKPFRYQRRGES